MEIEAVLIDWAGTITVPMYDMMMAAAEQSKLDEETMKKVFAVFGEYLSKDNTPFHQAEKGEIDDEELVDYFNERAPGSGVLFDVNSPTSFLYAQDRPEMLELLADLRDADVMVFLATNNFASAQELLATRYLETGLVSAIVNSALVGTRKPDDAYFELCLEALDLPGERVLFLDDQQRNLDAGATFGIKGLLVEADSESAVTQTRKLLGLTSE